MSVTKENLPDIKEVFNADGTLNSDAATAGAMKVMGQYAAGHIQFSNGKAKQTDLGRGKKHITIEFDRQE